MSAVSKLAGNLGILGNLGLHMHANAYLGRASILRYRGFPAQLDSQTKGFPAAGKRISGGLWDFDHKKITTPQKWGHEFPALPNPKRRFLRFCVNAVMLSERHPLSLIPVTLANDCFQPGILSLYHIVTPPKKRDFPTLEWDFLNNSPDLTELKGFVAFGQEANWPVDDEGLLSSDWIGRTGKHACAVGKELPWPVWHNPCSHLICSI